MKRKTVFLALVVLAGVLLISLGSAFADKTAYTGDWTCAAIDAGDGKLQTTYEGTSVADLVKLTFNEDGTLTVLSFGQTVTGTWEETSNGVSAKIEGETVAFESKDGQLINTSNGMTVYLKKAAPEKSGGLLSLVKGGKYAGQWAAVAVDEGDGVRKTEMDGVKVSEMLSFQINRDGTLTMTSMGEESAGTWQEIAGGIHVIVEDTSTDMLLQDGQLVAVSDGATIYFGRGDQAVQATAPPIPAPAFAGTWKAVRYETMGYSFDASLLFPEGCTITLREDGTGEAFITSAYKEQLTWAEKDGILLLAGSYVLSSPVWNAEKQELSLNYGSSSVTVIFQRSDGASVAPTAVPTPQPTPAPTPQPTPAPTPAPTLEPEPTAEVQSAPQCVTSLFSASFPEGWVEYESWRYDTDSYCAVKYELKDSSSSVLASISLSASSEGVDTYRDKIRALKGYAKKAGKDTLNQITVGGIAFSGTEYESWGWKYREYAARVPEAHMTLIITLEQPENMEGSLPAILQSIVYNLPVLSPPNVDPPLPEDGVPYEPKPEKTDAGKYTLTAAWLPTDKSIVLNSIFDNHIASMDGKLFVLAGDMLYAYKLDDDKLVPDPSFENGVMELSEEQDYLSAAGKGPLYVSEGIFSILAIQDGKITVENNLSGNLVMHPGGEWGISFWANADPQLVHAVNGTLRAEPWVLANLSDAATRKGRFSSIDCVYISETKIYVAGTDTKNSDAKRVAVYDLKGKELFDFGAVDWMADDAFGAVTGIVETDHGILVLDGNLRSFKLFSKDGEFLGATESDALLGTDYPWLTSVIPWEDGVLVAASQERKDESCDELLIFYVKGF